MGRALHHRRGRRGKLVSVACLIVAAAFAYRAAPATAGDEPTAARIDIAVGMPAPVVPALPPEADPPEPVVVTEPLRVLHLETLGTREPVDITPFDAAGEVVPDEMMKLSTLLAPRNPRGGPPDPEDVVRIDPALAALLLRISAELGDAPLVIVSGHRKPGRGTSKKSFHVKGMAADIAVAGVKPVEIRRAALRAGAGGVGLYPRFVHVDVREEPYRWGAGGGRPRLRRPAPSK